MKVVVLDGYAGNPGDLSWDELKKLGDCTIYDRTPAELTVERSKDADMVLTNKVVFTKETFDALPNLKYVGVMATGFNIIDLDAARAHGVIVTNVPAYSTRSVAQLVMAFILNVTNSVQHYTNEAHEGVWSKSPDFTYANTPIIELDGKVLGIYGLGNIGKMVAQLAMSFGMKVAAYTSKPQEALPEGITKVDLDTLFSQSDVVSLHCPLTAETRGLVNEARLRSMKKDALLINTARGPLVVEEDLAKVLKSGHLLGACLDVMTQEPPKADNPLLSIPNCYITPHVGWASKEARVRMMNIIISNVAAFIAGKPVNVVI